MAPLASGVPMGASHGIGYVLGAAFDIPHGHTSCIMLPAVMRWNEKANYSRQVRVSQAMGSPETSASQLLEKLIQDLGMPTRLSDVDINAKDFASIAEKAMGTPWVPHNPRKINGPSDVLEILKLAVQRMLPGGVLGKKQLTKLKIYSGSDHPHSSQNPKIIELSKLNSKNIARN